MNTIKVNDEYLYMDGDKFYISGATIEPTEVFNLLKVEEDYIIKNNSKYYVYSDEYKNEIYPVGEDLITLLKTIHIDKIIRLRDYDKKE